MGAFRGGITRNGSTIIADRVINISVTLDSGDLGIPADLPFFYVNRRITATVAPIMIGTFVAGYVYMAVNEANDTVFYARTAAGNIPANTEVILNFNCCIAD